MVVLAGGVTIEADGLAVSVDERGVEGKEGSKMEELLPLPLPLPLLLTFSMAKTSTIHSYQTLRLSVWRNMVTTIWEFSVTLRGVCYHSLAVSRNFFFVAYSC